MDYSLNKCVEEVKQKLIDKYIFSSFDMELRDDDSIGFWFQHKDIKNDQEFVKQLLDSSITLLKEKGYKYKHSSLYPNPLQITETTYNAQRPNDTTEDLYSLVRVKE